MHWCAGCIADDDYNLAIEEVLATQNLNSRSQKNKTYHLMISFRPEDKSKFNPKIFKDIEREFASALGRTPALLRSASEYKDILPKSFGSYTTR